MSKTNHDLLGIYPKLVLTINFYNMIYLSREHFFPFFSCMFWFNFFLSWDFGKLIFYLNYIWDQKL
jgi:hypothetical protein